MPEFNASNALFWPDLWATKYATGTYNSLSYKDSPTPKLAAKRSANLVQIQFRFNSDSIQIELRFSSDLIYFKSPYAHFRRHQFY
ncbi:hypothetical protein ACN38_g2971 [Penicillium nordicum]|uniref:Uncharacterized protein n=1 Tax=Penicillium nordicum TaxID=229535 RepID=A0A0M8P5X5_9EURO|nr:hypothetical protein ACN38_g2971 [Penicillium nordicum]